MVFGFLTRGREKRDFAANIGNLLEKGPVDVGQCNEKDCGYRATRLRDLTDYAKINLSKETLTIQYLETARDFCQSCPRTLEGNNCKDVFRRVEEARKYLINS